MLAKIVYIDIGEKIYPMTFSLACLKHMDDIQEIAKKVQKDESLSDSADVIAKMLTAMITSGCQYCNQMRLVNYKNSPAVDGYITPLTEEQIMYSIPATQEDLKYVIKKIQLCVNVSNSKSIQATTPIGSKKKKKNR